MTQEDEVPKPEDQRTQDVRTEGGSTTAIFKNMGAAHFTACFMLALCLISLYHAWPRTGVVLVDLEARSNAATKLDPARTQEEHERDDASPVDINHIRSVCDKYNLTGKGELDSNEGISIDKEHKLILCENPKAASQLLSRHFAVIAGVAGSTKALNRLGKEEVFKRLRELGSTSHGIKTVEALRRYMEEEEAKNDGRHPVLFSFVRHPFDRLVSAFENKVYYHWDPARTFQELAGRMHGKFHKFARYVIRRANEKFHCSGSECRLNRHWRPMSVNCAFCALDYTFVGKTEALEEDLTRLLELAGVGAVPGLRLTLHTNAMPPKPNKTMKYFKTLSPEVVRKLYQIYKLDFEMFGYSAKNYLTLKKKK